VLALLLPACTVSTADPAMREGWYLGLIRVERPAATGAVRAVDLRSFGLGVDQGVWVGFRALDTISAPPGQCSFTLIVRDDADLRHALTLIEALEGQPCTVDFARSSR
jgi:hypothetical protein